MSNERKIIPFMKLKWFFMAGSIVVVALSIFIMFSHGFNFGVDFKGGIKLVYKFTESVGDEKLHEAIDPMDLGDVQIMGFGDPKDNSFLIKVKYQEGRDLSKDITDKLSSIYAGKVTLQSDETVGPNVGAELRKRGIFSVVLTLVLILIYIGWRFDFLFAPGAIIALIHDVAFCLGAFNFAHKEFNLPILAAVLTLIGYSNNDTIIIYDRVRENLKKLPGTVTLENLINISLSETMSRTIVTHLTVLFSMIVLYVFGGGVIHDFAFFMIIGVVVGAYSSIFIASPIYLALCKYFPEKGMNRTHK